jgi:hypothetical protein
MADFVLYNTSCVTTLYKADSFEQVYKALPEDGVYDTETCKRDLVKNICSKYTMCIWLEYRSD